MLDPYTIKLINDNYKKYLDDRIYEFDFVYIFNKLIVSDDLCDSVKTSVYYILDIFFYKCSIENMENEKHIITEMLKQNHCRNKEFFLYVIVYLCNINFNKTNLYI